MSDLVGNPNCRFSHAQAHFELVYFREFLTGFIVTVENYIRGAIQCFCVEILLNLTDKVSNT